jgi:hypothetical protein
LKKVDVARNPWEHDEHHPYFPSQAGEYQGCIEALLEGMLENYSMESLQITRADQRLEHCTHVNRVRKNALALSHSIPLGLWPLILQQVGTPKWQPTGDEGRQYLKYHANALFLLWQSCPALPSVPQRTLLRRSRRKRKLVDRYC